MERLKKTLIKPDCTIKHALKQMDALGEKTLMVVDNDNNLIGIVSDGDIRGWILKKRSISKQISKVMNYSPVTLKKGYSSREAGDFMLKHGQNYLPIVDDNNKLISAVWWGDVFGNKPKSSKALNLPVVIMAGGEGTRLTPFTKIFPKPLMPIGDKPIIEIIINKFIANGCNNFYLSLNYKSKIIKAYFSEFKHRYKIAYIQENKPLGTAGSLYFLRNRIRKTFFLSNCDVLVEADYSDILEFHLQSKNMITLISTMKNFTIPYGVCNIKDSGMLKSIKEKPEYDLLVSTGMYVMEASVLKEVPNRQFYDMTDLINSGLKKKWKIGVYPISEKSWVDIGQLDVLQEMLKKIDL
jgi:dTDP-glucose pyrophosphorylase